MTAISAFKSQDSVHIFSDGAWHDPASGKLCGIGTKVSILPEYTAVFAVTGLSTIPILLLAQLLENQFAGLPSLAAAMPDLLRTCVNRGRAVGLTLTDRCDVVLAGWSESAGPSIHVTQCFFDHEIFKGAAVERYIRPSVDGSPNMHFPEDGLMLLEKQHATKIQRAAEGTFGGVTVGGLVGGFAQHTQIDAEGIQIKVLKRWPDRIDNRQGLAARPIPEPDQSM
ncbi:hypothetical protein IVB33_18935 [Bradyrhizobium sp. 24]|uniref:hypothetical protein n=1 Tax=unclassified Bradyrhizobium TaxID=2631580 RepID=UPI001FFA57F7|nr:MULTISPECIES: hypothetical protein [unclassified Bradyrhizobium]MCK1299611.1 hypothetical protein [Bradyrhizobium sp. 37]MCK1379594.1 hypothetical protein [Bradyrhizobium sp. 24]MCK1769389.1 hypothetical protein [Bradyrhizobium sp. 134]